MNRICKRKKKKIEEILRILNELEINKGSLILHDESDEFFKLNTDYYKLILANSGRSIMTYIIARETVKRIKKICSISKMKILSKITKIFVMFKFIESEEEADFLSNLYRQLNRIDKDKEEQIKQIIARKISIFYPDINK